MEKFIVDANFVDDVGEMIVDANFVDCKFC